MSHLPTYEDIIVGASVRMNWRGKPVLQIRRKLMRCRSVGSGDPIGIGPWRDARKRDLIEVSLFLTLHANVKQEPNE